MVDGRPNVGVKKLGKWSFEKYHEGFLYPLRKHHHQRRLFIFMNNINLLMDSPLVLEKNMEGI